MATETNDTRTRTVLLHKSIGTVEFAWDESEWVVVCFNPRLSIPYWILYGIQLPNDQAISVTKDTGRKLWEEFVRQGWKEWKEWRNGNG